MPKHKDTVIDRIIANEVGDARKIRLLMETREGSVGRWAINRGYFPAQVHQCLGGQRAYPEIRSAIAEFLGTERDLVDSFIDGVAA